LGRRWAVTWRREFGKSVEWETKVLLRSIIKRAKGKVRHVGSQGNAWRRNRSVVVIVITLFALLPLLAVDGTEVEEVHFST